MEDEVLVPKGKKFKEMTREELSACGKVGGKRSGETRRNKSTMKTTLDILLSMPLKNGKQSDIEAIRNFASLKGKNITVEQAMLIAQIQKAMKGDTSALQFIRDTSGQKPEDNYTVTAITENPYDELSVEELKALAKKCDENETS